MKIIHLVLILFFAVVAAVPEKERLTDLEKEARFLEDGVIVERDTSYPEP